MILLFVVVAWIGLLSIVVGLCLAARWVTAPGWRASARAGSRPCRAPARASPRAAEPRHALFDRDGVAA